MQQSHATDAQVAVNVVNEPAENREQISGGIVPPRREEDLNRSDSIDR